MHVVYYIVLVPMVYAALAVFIVGSAWQGVRIWRGLNPTLETRVGPTRTPKRLGAVYEILLSPELLRSHPVHWVFLAVSHLALLLLLVGHLELFGEIRAFQIIPHRIFLGAGVVGITLLVALLFFLCRRFHTPVREVSEPGNYYMLIVLLLAVLFGTQLHLARRWFGYSTIDVDSYRAYLSSLLTFRPALPELFTDEVVGHPLLLVLHVFFASLFLLLFPMSRMMHALLALPLARLRRG